METEPDLPADVLRFITDRIDSVPHLETLLLLWESRDHRWSEAEVANRVYVPGDTARSVLQRLAQQRLICTVAEEGPAPQTLYVYDPAWDETTGLMPRVAATYRRQLVRVAKVIHAKAPPSIQAFARAFQLKKDP
jgi:hypothetical protein